MGDYRFVGDLGKISLFIFFCRDQFREEPISRDSSGRDR